MPYYWKCPAAKWLNVQISRNLNPLLCDQIVTTWPAQLLSWLLLTIHTTLDFPTECCVNIFIVGPQVDILLQTWIRNHWIRVIISWLDESFSLKSSEKNYHPDTRWLMMNSTSQRPWMRFWETKMSASPCTCLWHAHVLKVRINWLFSIWRQF